MNNGWNKIEDKMPTESILVEVYSTSLGEFFGRWYGYTTRENNKNFDLEWYTIDVDTIPSVTHWREMTPPPNE